MSQENENPETDLNESLKCFITWANSMRFLQVYDSALVNVSIQQQLLKKKNFSKLK